MNVPPAKDPTAPPCPVCALPTFSHCRSGSCDWRKCPRCPITIGRRVMNRDGKTVP